VHLQSIESRKTREEGSPADPDTKDEEAIDATVRSRVEEGRGPD
jgi:hypothetical protein